MNNLQSSEHRSIDELLPWYVNNTLDDRERVRVERHLKTCATCQENAQLWSQVQSAVRSDSPVPFVPEPNDSALLDAVEKDSRRWYADGARAPYLVAASVLLVITAAVFFTVGSRVTPETPTQFETVTSESADPMVQYIIEMRFKKSATPEQRRGILDTLGNVTLDTPVDAELLTLHLGAGSLPELQARMDDARALPHVIDVRIVAVHLPVD